MLHLALTLLCLAQILHFSRHWLVLTRRMREEAKDQRIKTHLKWKKQREIYGSTVPGSALQR